MGLLIGRPKGIKALGNTHVFFVVMLNGFAGDGTVASSSFDGFMPEQFLHLFDWHPDVKQICGAGPTESVRMDIAYFGMAADISDDFFQTVPCQAPMRRFYTDEQGRIIVCS